MEVTPEAPALCRTRRQGDRPEPHPRGTARGRPQRPDGGGGPPAGRGRAGPAPTASGAEQVPTSTRRTEEHRQMNPVIATHGLDQALRRQDRGGSPRPGRARRGRSSPCSATTARASPRPSACSPACCRPTPAGPTSSARTAGRRPPDLRRRVGYVPERPRFYDWMTVREIGWFTAGFHAAGYLPRYLDLIDRFRLDPAAQLQEPLQGRLRQGRPGPGPGLRPGSADPRRADLRPRPVHPPRVPGQHGRPRRRGADHPHLQPRHRRGGARRQPRRLPGRGPAAAGRAPGRAAAAHRPRPAALRRPRRRTPRRSARCWKRKRPAGSGRRSCSTPTAPPWTPCASGATSTESRRRR